MLRGTHVSAPRGSPTATTACRHTCLSLKPPSTAPRVRQVPHTEFSFLPLPSSLNRKEPHASLHVAPLHWFCTAGTDCAMACTDHCSQLLEDMLTIVRDECRGMSDAPPLRNSAKCLERPVSQRQMSPSAVPRVGQADIGPGGLASWPNGLRFARQVYDEEVWLHAMAVRTKPVPSTSVYRAALPAAYWT